MKEDVRVTLQRLSEQVSYAAELLIAEKQDWQLIKMYLANRLKDMPLTTGQKSKLERYQFIYNQLVSGKYTNPEVVSQVKKLYSVSQSQAYADINAAKEIFNSIVTYNKQFEITQELEINRQMLRMARELQDVKGFAALEKNRAALIKMLPDTMDNASEYFEGHTYNMTFDPSLIGAPPVDMKELLATINAKRNKHIKTDMFEELDYKEIKKEKN